VLASRCITSCPHTATPCHLVDRTRRRHCLTGRQMIAQAMISWTVCCLLFFFRPANSYSSTGVPLDPFLIVQPSLNDSLLVKQGLVEETVPPPPTHNPHDIQVCFVLGSWLGLTRSFVIGSTVPGWPKGQYVVADEIAERKRKYFYFNPTVPVAEGLHILCHSHARFFSKRG
jgi:hypothetical protein